MKVKHLLLLPFFFAACQSASDSSSAADSAAIESENATAPSDSQATAIDTFKNIPDTKLIVPGKQIGETRIGETDKELFSVMKKPDAGDAAMGKAWSTWYSKPSPGDTDTTRHETNVFTVRRNGVDNDTAKVKLIRVTSPFFATKTRVSANRPMDYVQKVFPGIKKVATFPDKNGEMSVFDDQAAGIAFEAQGEGKTAVCRAVIVHAPGTPLLDDFMGLHNDLKKR
ncbi:MAG: hypothetical protein INR69_02265 [Mucilaginibacter polytrichastri]|nr:hypothetical protein [Mucilaginibacter polytrichastri]